MTKIYLKKDSVFGYNEISVSGHSGYSDEGSDIVCAYISSACDLVMRILIDEVRVVAETDIDPEKAFVRLSIPHSEHNITVSSVIRVCLEGFVNQMKDFSKQFPKFVSIRIA